MTTTILNRPKGRPLSRAGVAEFFGVSPTTVDAWRRRGCPVVKRATTRGSGANGWQFDSAAVSSWLRLEAATNAAGDTSKVGLEEARRRKMAAEALLAELEVQERRGDFLPKAEMVAVWCRLASNFRARILAAPSKLAGVLVGITDPAVISTKIQEELVAALAELSGEENFTTFVRDLEKDPPQGDAAEEAP